MSTAPRPRGAVLAGALLLGALLPAAAPADELRAGFGTAPLPTPDGGPLGGYGGLRDRNARGQLDPPEARALVLDQAGVRIGLVAVDLVIVRPALRDALLERARERGVDALVLVATHTHSGPGGYIEGWLAERVTSGRFDPETPARLARAAGRALERAVADLGPAEVASAAGELELARNRRLENGRRETALPVLRVDKREGDPVLAFAYGAHPTVLSPRSRVYSADYVGSARAWLEKRGWRALFLPGPLGDQVPTPDDGELWPDDPDAERRQRLEIGRRLASAVEAQARGLQPAPAAELVALERWVEPPPVRLRRFCALWWLGPLVNGTVRSFLSSRVPVHAVRVGAAELVALPAEPASAVGEAIRRRMHPDRVSFVVAHANDWLGYVVAPDAYQRGGYEACLSFHGPGLGPWLVEEAAETLRLLERRGLDQARRAPGVASAEGGR